MFGPSGGKPHGRIGWRTRSALAGVAGRLLALFYRIGHALFLSCVRPDTSIACSSEALEPISRFLSPPPLPICLALRQGRPSAAAIGRPARPCAACAAAWSTLGAKLRDAPGEGERIYWRNCFRVAQFILSLLREGKPHGRINRRSHPEPARYHAR